MKRTLSLPFGGEVKEQDVYLPIAALRSHPAGIEALFDWMTTNWDELCKRFPAGLSMLGTIVTLCTNGFTSKEQMARVEKFFGDKSTKGFDQGLAQSLDAIRAKHAWIVRDRAVVEGWVRENGYLGQGAVKSEL